MAAKRKAARKAVRAPRAAVPADLLSKAAQLRLEAAHEAHGGTSLAKRVAALELLVAALTG